MQQRALSLAALFFVGCTSQANMSCSTNGTPCPPPSWAPRWELVDSTICQPGGPSHTSGFFSMPAEQPWGLVSLDWTVALALWNRTGLHNGTVEAVSREGCRLLKANHSATRCFIYHNMELALESIESQRAAMYPGEPHYDPALFLHYTTGPAAGRVYNERNTPGDQYFWNYTLDKTKAFFRDAVMASIAYPEVDGTFADDVNGVPDEHGHVPSALNLSAADIDVYRYHTSLANQMLVDAAIAAGKYVWAAFGAQDGVGDGPTNATCAAWMRARCTADWQRGRATTQAVDERAFNQSLAAFLVTRGPWAFLGFGGVSDMRDWRSEFLWSVGEPTPAGAVCAEAPAGVFSRQWTYGIAALDCNTWTARVPAV